jgi:hypothetical protein
MASRGQLCSSAARPACPSSGGNDWLRAVRSIDVLKSLDAVCDLITRKTWSKKMAAILLQKAHSATQSRQGWLKVERARLKVGRTGISNMLRPRLLQRQCDFAGETPSREAIATPRSRQGDYLAAGVAVFKVGPGGRYSVSLTSHGSVCGASSMTDPAVEARSRASSAFVQAVTRHEESTAPAVRSHFIPPSKNAVFQINLNYITHINELQINGGSSPWRRDYWSFTE